MEKQVWCLNNSVPAFGSESVGGGRSWALPVTWTVVSQWEPHSNSATSSSPRTRRKASLWETRGLKYRAPGLLCLPLLSCHASHSRLPLARVPVLSIYSVPLESASTGPWPPVCPAPRWPGSSPRTRCSRPRPRRAAGRIPLPGAPCRSRRSPPPGPRAAAGSGPSRASCRQTRSTRRPGPRLLRCRCRCRRRRWTRRPGPRRRGASRRRRRGSGPSVGRTWWPPWCPASGSRPWPSPPCTLASAGKWR